MNLHRATIGLGAVAIGMMLTIAPTAPAWGASTTKGSNPNGAFCKLEKSVLKDDNSKIEDQASTALEAGKWSVAQKDLETIDKQTGKLEVELLAALSSAPKNVKAAAQQVIKIVPAEEKAVTNSHSVKQFEAAEEAVTSTKFQSAATVLESYNTSQCGSGTP
jgi:thioredoxin-like negative regulator of GroEL